MRRVDGVALAVLVAGRPGTGRGSPAALAAAARVAVTRLHALSPAGTGRLVEDEWQDSPPGVVETCHRVTGGNPWLIGELLEELRAAGSSPGAIVDGAVEHLVGVQDGVRGRLIRLGDPAVRLAQAIAVLGDGCELPHAGKLAELTPAEAAQAATALVGAGHLVDRQRLAFAHPLVRAAVRDSMPAAVRAATHSRAAALLRSEGADGELIAGQLLASSPVGAGWAAGVLLNTAGSALARGAPETAVRHLRRALEELPPSEQNGTLRALGNALARLADPAATGVLERALRAAPDPGIRSRIADEAVDPLMFAGLRASAVDLSCRCSPTRPRHCMTTYLAGRLAMIQALQGGAGTPAVAALRARVCPTGRGGA